MHIEIGGKIRKERKLSKMTLDALSRKIGISKMTLQRIETGKTSPSIAVLGDICQALQKSINMFVGEESNYFRIMRVNGQFALSSDNIVSRILCPRGSLKIPEGGNMAIYFVEVKDKTELELHKNRGFEWVFQISGTSEFYYDNKKYICNEGDVFFYDGTHPHSVKYCGDNSFILISFK